MSRLASDYLGFDLRSPIVASSGPLTGRLDMLRRLEDAGIAAVVLPSLFEEEITHAATELHWMLETGAHSTPEALNFFPEIEEYKTSPERYIDLIGSAKEALSIPVIASLNGATSGGWAEYASELADAGADAIELNVYLVVADQDRSAAEVESMYAEIVKVVRDDVSIPLSVKLGPYFTSLSHLAVCLVDSGADGLVLFNRFYQPDIDVVTREICPDLALSSSAELRLPLRWIAMLAGRLNASLALSTGVHTAGDLAKALLAGADAVMTTSALIKHGPDLVGAMETGLLEWMDEHEYESVKQLRGSASQRSIADPSDFERANYVDTLRRYSSPFARKFGI